MSDDDKYISIQIPTAPLRDAIDKWGATMQEDILIEEMSELIKAIIKFRRGGSGRALDMVIQEIADVYIMLGQITLSWGEAGVQIYINDKISRLKERLNGFEENP